MRNKTKLIKLPPQTDVAFIEMVNHELKSPLTTIKLFIETLEKRIENSSKEELRNNIKIIDQKIDYLTSQINDYTDIVRIRSGNFDFEFKNLSLTVVLNNCFQKIKERYDHIVIKNAKLSNKIIKADEHRLYQVFNSLIAYINKISGNIEDVSIETKIFSHHIVFNIRPLSYQYPAEMGLDFINPETLTNDQIKILNIRENQRIGSSLASEIINHHHGKFITCSDINSKIACCFSLPFFK